MVVDMSWWCGTERKLSVLWEDLLSRKEENERQKKLMVYGYNGVSFACAQTDSKMYYWWWNTHREKEREWVNSVHKRREQIETTGENIHSYTTHILTDTPTCTTAASACDIVCVCVRCVCVESCVSSRTHSHITKACRMSFEVWKGLAALLSVSSFLFVVFQQHTHTYTKSQRKLRCDHVYKFSRALILHSYTRISLF